jgi:hypothetical protein
LDLPSGSFGMKALNFRWYMACVWVLWFVIVGC